MYSNANRVIEADLSRGIISAKLIFALDIGRDLHNDFCDRFPETNEAAIPLFVRWLKNPVECPDGVRHMAFLLASDVRMANALLNNGADINSQGVVNDGEGKILGKGFCALSIAAIHGNPEVMNVLLARGANPNLQDSQGYTSLHWAAQNNSMEIVKLLVENGNADVGLLTKNGWTAADLALSRGFLELAAYLGAQK